MLLNISDMMSTNENVYNFLIFLRKKFKKKMESKTSNGVLKLQMIVSAQKNATMTIA
jgi:hypothetical protein